MTEKERDISEKEERLENIENSILRISEKIGMMNSKINKMRGVESKIRRFKNSILTGFFVAFMVSGFRAMSVIFSNYFNNISKVIPPTVTTLAIGLFLIYFYFTFPD